MECNEGFFRGSHGISGRNFAFSTFFSKKMVEIHLNFHRDFFLHTVSKRSAFSQNNSQIFIFIFIFMLLLLLFFFLNVHSGSSHLCCVSPSFPRGCLPSRNAFATQAPRATPGCRMRSRGPKGPSAAVPRMRRRIWGISSTGAFRGVGYPAGWEVGWLSSVDFLKISEMFENKSWF